MQCAAPGFTVFSCGQVTEMPHTLDSSPSKQLADQGNWALGGGTYHRDLGVTCPQLPLAVLA